MQAEASLLVPVVVQAGAVVLGVKVLGVGQATMAVVGPPGVAGARGE
jgi:hypothetical protein